MNIKTVFVATLVFGLSTTSIVPNTAVFAGDTLKVEQWFDYERVGGARISPDGKNIIYTRSHVDQINDRFKGEMWIMNVNGSKNRFLTKGGGAAWTPSSDRIAFTKRAGKEGNEIFVRWMDAEGAITQISHFKYSPKNLSWSPDGKWIAFKANVPFKPKYRVKLPPRPKGAKWTAEPRVIDTRNYRRDRQGFFKGNDHIFVIPADGGTARQLTSSNDWGAGGALEWTPDGSHILFSGYTAAKDNDVPDQSYIYKVNVTSDDITQLTKQIGSWNSPKVSPNGKLVVYKGSAEFQDTFNTPEVRMVGIDGSNEHVVKHDFTDSPSAATWASNGRSLLMNIDHRGATNMYRLDLKGKLTQITKGLHRFRVSSMSDKGFAAGTFSSPTGDGIIATASMRGNGSINKLINVNADIMANVDLGKVEDINYKASDGTDVHGWVMFPPNFDRTKKYPLVLNIHGGPHGDYGYQFDFKFQDWAANDYVVLYTNPRGSTSYGTAFAKAINGAYPGEFDYDDLMSGVDHMLRSGFVDKDRLFVTGCSGGGILTAWIVGQTDRFKAAAALCPIVDWMGMEGTSDVIGWGEKMFKTKFWDDPEPWLAHSSMQNIGKVKTPTMLMTGENDMRTSPVEAERFYQGLLRMGVPTKLVYMRDENHGTTSKPTNMLRTQKIIQKWFDEWDPGKRD